MGEVVETTPLQIEYHNPENGALVLNDHGYELVRYPNAMVMSGPYGPITWRPTEDYSYTIPAIKELTPDKQVTEIGPGLAQFIHDFAEHAAVQPIAIEPINYRQVLRLCNGQNRSEKVHMLPSLIR